MTDSIKRYYERRQKRLDARGICTEHMDYGVKGMKWGHHKAKAEEPTIKSAISKQQAWKEFKGGAEEEYREEFKQISNNLKKAADKLERLGDYDNAAEKLRDMADEVKAWASKESEEIYNIVSYSNGKSEPYLCEASDALQDVVEDDDMFMKFYNGDFDEDDIEEFSDEREYDDGPDPDAAYEEYKERQYGDW